MIHPFNHDEHSPLAKASSLLITADFPAWGGGHVVDDQQQFIPFATHLIAAISIKGKLQKAEENEHV